MTQPNAVTPKPWVRIPDGTMVRHQPDGQDGFIDGLTELIAGSRRNPDGKTQYRINVGDPNRMLAVEDDLLILTDPEGLVKMVKQKGEYRRFVTDQLRGVLTADRFVRAA